jgi:lipoate-protein ligase A
VKVRLILDEPARGAWNMAVDEALLESVSEGSSPTLRIYRWSEPTLSLGYFQNYADRSEHAASLACPAVRRSSGGGAIVHDQEWTYSFTLPITDRASADRRRLYLCVHGALVETLNATNAPAKLCEIEENTETPHEPFLCFARRCYTDVVLGGHKVCGSAQRRSRAAVMQHGTVLLAASRAAPELLGIQELTAFKSSPEELQTNWLEHVAANLGLIYDEGRLSDAEKNLAWKLEMEKHTQLSWIRRR